MGSKSDHIGDAKKMGEVLHRAWYHADEDGDYNIYDALNAECPDCIEVLIVRPDHIADAGKVVWAVIDRDNQIAFSVTPDDEYKEEWAVSLCHEHINEAISDGIEGAAKWVVRPLTIGTATPSVPEEEIKAKALEEFAAHMGDCIALWRMAKEEGLRGTIRASEEWANKMKRNAARLRARQQEGNTAGDDGEGV